MKNKTIIFLGLILLLSNVYAIDLSTQYYGYGFNISKTAEYANHFVLSSYSPMYILLDGGDEYNVTIKYRCSYFGGSYYLKIYRLDLDNNRVEVASGDCTSGSLRTLSYSGEFPYGRVELFGYFVGGGGGITIYKNSSIEFIGDLSPYYSFKEGYNESFNVVNKYDDDGYMSVVVIGDDDSALIYNGNVGVEYKEITALIDCNLFSSSDSIAELQIYNYNKTDYTQYQYYAYYVNASDIGSPSIEYMIPVNDVIEIEKDTNQEFTLRPDILSIGRVEKSVFEVHGYALDIHYVKEVNNYTPVFNFTFDENGMYEIQFKHFLTCNDYVFYSWDINVGNYMTLFGYVFDNSTLETINNAQVIIHNPDLSNYWGYTDINGYYEITGIFEGNYTSWIEIGELLTSYIDVDYNINITQTQCGTKLCRYDYYLQPLTGNSLITVYFIDYTNYSSSGGWMDYLYNFTYSVRSSLYSPEKEILRIENGVVAVEESDIISIKKNISGLPGVTQYIQYYVKSTNMYENIFEINKTGYYAFYSQYYIEGGGDSSYDYADSFEYPIYSDVVLWHNMRNLSDFQEWNISFHFVDGSNTSIDLEGVSATLYNMNNFSSYILISNESGVTEFLNMNEGSYKLMVSKNNYFNVELMNIELYSNAEFEISMYKDTQNIMTIDGKIKDCDLSVYLNEVELKFKHVVTLNNYSCMSNENGYFSITLPKGEYNIILSKEYYNDLYINQNFLIDYSFTGINELCLSNDGTLSSALIHVKNNESISIENCDIYITHPDKEDFIKHEKTNFNGDSLFILEKSTNKYQIDISCSGYTSCTEFEYILKGTESFEYIMYAPISELEEFLIVPSSLEELIIWLGKYIWGIFFIILLLFVFYICFFMIKKIGII